MVATITCSLQTGRGSNHRMLSTEEKGGSNYMLSTDEKGGNKYMISTDKKVHVEQ